MTRCWPRPRRARSRLAYGSCVVQQVWFKYGLRAIDQRPRAEAAAMGRSPPPRAARMPAGAAPMLLLAPLTTALSPQLPPDQKPAICPFRQSSEWRHDEQPTKPSETRHHPPHRGKRSRPAEQSAGGRAHMYPRHSRLRGQSWPQLRIAARYIDPFEAIRARSRPIECNLARAHRAATIVIDLQARHVR
jgi:hypothetical protein